MLKRILKGFLIVRDFVIMTDSSCDLPINVVQENDIRVAPMSIQFDGVNYKHYYDYRELPIDQFYDGMKAGKIGSTAGTNIQDAMSLMQTELDEDKDVIFLSISSGLSCSYQNVCLAAEELREEYPNARIEIVDTKCVCSSLGLVTYLVANKKNNGFDYDSTLAYAKEICNHTHINFTVEDLSYLQRSGRISHLSSIVGTIIGIKPLLTIGNDGKIATTGKVRGRKASLRQIVDNAKQNCTENSVFMISHASAPDDAIIVEDALKEQYPDAQFIVSNIGPIIGVNTGIGTLAVACVGNSR
jgi:DegV family protein with EDD domain